MNSCSNQKSNCFLAQKLNNPMNCGNFFLLLYVTHVFISSPRFLLFYLLFRKNQTYAQTECLNGTEELVIRIAT